MTVFQCDSFGLDKRSRHFSMLCFGYSPEKKKGLPFGIPISFCDFVSEKKKGLCEKTSVKPSSLVKPISLHPHCLM